MLTEVIRELTKCEENVIVPSETVLAWAKIVDVQRAQTVVISILCELKNFYAIRHKQNRPRDKNMQVTQSSPESVSTADKSINQDDAWHMIKVATNVARSTTLKWYAEGPRSAWSTLLREKIFMSSNLA